MKLKRCLWCGQPLNPTHGNQRYHQVNDEGIECYKEHRREVKRDFKRRYYRNNRIRIDAKTKGTGWLGPHRHPKGLSEYVEIQKEFKRLHLKHKSLAYHSNQKNTVYS